MEENKFGDKLYVEHILEAIKKIEKFIGNSGFDDFEKNEQLQSAIVREISVIGEAAKKLSEDFKKSKPVIPWEDVVGMRDKLVHDYFEIDMNMVWKTATEDLKPLKQALKPLEK